MKMSKRHVLVVSLHTKEAIEKSVARQLTEAGLKTLLLSPFSVDGGEATVTKVSVRRVDIE